MTLPTPARLVAYLRDSGGPDQDLSLAQQEGAIRAWAAEHNHTITRIFKDEALSGTTTAGRHGFEALLQYFRSPDCQAHGLILWKFSRLARDFDDAQFFKADLRRRGFAILAIQDKVPEGSMGRFFEAAIDYMNERYSNDLASDVRRGLRHAIHSHGIVPGDRTKPGFKRQEVHIGTKRNGQPHVAHRWVIDPEVAPKVLDAFRMKAAGASAKEIHAKHQLYSGVHGYSYLWGAEIYRGRFRFGGDPANAIVVENYVEPIVDQATWDAVQARIQKYREGHHSSARHPRRVASRYLLSGLVKCDRCGYMLVGGSSLNKEKRRYGYYNCRSGALRPDLGCATYVVSAEKLEAAVLGSLKEFILAPANLQRIQAAAETLARQARKQARPDDLKPRWKRVTTEIGHLVAAITAAGHSEALLDRLQALEQEKAQLEIKMGESARVQPIRVPHIEEVTRNAATILDALSQDRALAKRLLSNLIKEIRVKRDGKKVLGEIVYYLPQNEITSTGLGFQQPTGKDFASMLSRPA